MLRKLEEIPVKTTFEQVAKRIGIEDEEDIALVSGLFSKAKEIAKPKAIYREAFVDKVCGNEVFIDGTLFESNVLRMMLKDTHRVFAYICTCGTEVDDWSRKEGDSIVSIWLDMIKEMFLGEAKAFLSEHIKKAYQIKNISAVNPGSGNEENWPISQQQQLFNLIGDVKKEVGVTLTESFLMVPIKSTSGLLFPSDSGFANCSLCNRENCIGRHAEFDADLYARTFTSDSFEKL